MYKITLQFIGAIMVTGLLTSCSDTSSGTDPEPEITTGTVKVTAATTGDGTDGDGYEVTLDEESKSLEINKKLADMTLTEMDVFWEEAKKI